MISKKGLGILAFLALIALCVYFTHANNQDDDEIRLLNSFQNVYSQALRDSSSNWLNYKDTCYVYLYRGGGAPKSALATFDLDDTLTKPKSNPNIPVNATDWEFLTNNTKSRVEQVTGRGEASRFLVFTNQGGVGKGRVTLDEIKKRLELVVEGLDIPCTVFVATKRDEFRKPETGMFRLFEKAFKGPVEINYNQSFFCGDALGYPAFSDSDLRFAQNLSMPFINPDDFLMGKKARLVESK